VSAVAIWLVALAVVAAAVSMILRPRSIPSGAPVAIRRRRSRLARLPASLLGSLTVLLPCGALWAALALAVATGSAAGGAAAMALFAVMSGAAIAGASTLLGWMRRSRWLFAAALVTGAVMLALAPASRLAAGGADHPPSCPMHEAP
jgi:sulfite exporter TauE/SafE